jgi:dipeptidyl aminopeptidase/acylaminoacyl peptidase
MELVILKPWARDTHKFESRYTDNLVAPYPSGRDLYLTRSPINHVEKLNCPVIFFQGLDDKVVPPNQAEAMVNALRDKGIPVAYIAYEGESHGFRKAENIIRTIQAEQYFFSRIFEISLDASSMAVEIENLPAEKSK